LAVKSRKTLEHIFSIELKSKMHIKSFNLPEEEESDVLIQGSLGDLKTVRFTEGIMLEIEGTNGSLRMDLTEKELKRLLPKRILIQADTSLQNGK
jgi:hypothetical protein